MNTLFTMGAAIALLWLATDNFTSLDVTALGLAALALAIGFMISLYWMAKFDMREIEGMMNGDDE